MVVVRLRGGLGNQLFQYAFARGINVRAGVDVKLDSVSSFANDFYGRSYSLHHFNIRLPLVPQEEIISLLPRSRLWTLWHGLRRTIVAERSARHERSWESLDFSRDRYLIGFWQTEKY